MAKTAKKTPKVTKSVTQKQLYKLVGGFGLVLTVVLLAVAVGVSVGHNFATQQVHDQLVQEKISFPAAGTNELDPTTFPGLQQYAGQSVDTGVKAKAYADEFIWVHMMKASGGKSYAEASAAASADKTDVKLAGIKEKMFQGDMLRSSLLTAYAFSVLGTIAGYAYYGALVAAAIVFGFTLVSLAKSRHA